MSKQAAPGVPIPVRVGDDTAFLILPAEAAEEAAATCRARMAKAAKEVRAAGSALDACGDGTPGAVRAARLDRYLRALNEWLDQSDALRTISGEDDS